MEWESSMMDGKAVRVRVPRQPSSTSSSMVKRERAELRRGIGGGC